jgi:hypothetical protein
VSSTASNSAEAAAILRDYWGPSGPDKTLRAGELRGLKLKPDEIENLLDDLPPRNSGGTTGQRVDECYRLLERITGPQGLLGRVRR